MGDCSETVQSVGEFGMIARVNAAAAVPLPAGCVGAGDDAAVVPPSLLAPGTNLVITSDVMVEERHFSFTFGTAEDLGWKLLAVNLSDLAAMGARPVGFTVTMQLRRDLPAAVVEGIARGIGMLARESGVLLLGGDTTEGTECAFGITAVGTAGDVLRRSAAAAGDDLWVSGTIGGGGAGLRRFRESAAGGVEGVERYLRPRPRIALGRLLADEHLARCAIDVSDGLLQDAGHIARASGVTLEIELGAVPLSPAMEGTGMTALDGATAGDDYELLFTAPRSARELIAAVHTRDATLPPCTRIGTVGPLSGPPVLVRAGDGSLRTPEQLGVQPGYTHFSGAS